MLSVSEASKIPPDQSLTASSQPRHAHVMLSANRVSKRRPLKIPQSRQIGYPAATWLAASLDSSLRAQNDKVEQDAGFPLRRTYAPKFRTHVTRL